MTILHKIHRMFSKHWLEMHIILFCAIDASIRLVGNLQFFVDKRGCYYKAAWMNALFLSIGYKWTAFWRWPFIQMTLLGFLTLFSFFFWWLHMHSVGFEPMRSAFILFLQGDGVPFDLELIGYVWQERNNNIFEDNERSLDILKLLFFTLFQWAHIWIFKQCISISAFLQFVSFSSWAFCIFSCPGCSSSWTRCSFYSIKVLLPIKKKSVGLAEIWLFICRANAQQPKLFVGMILILIFAEALALYGLIVGIILSSRAGQSRAD